MIPSRKKRWFLRIFGCFLRRRIQRHFSQVWVSGLQHLEAAQGSVLLFSNHSAWWDSMWLFDVVERILRRDGYCLMDERSLRALPVLGWIGGFGVRLKDKADGELVTAYAASLLNEPAPKRPRLVALFPQGRETPVSVRPVTFKPGLQRIAEQAPNALLIPMAIRYEHGREEKPYAVLSFGAPLSERTTSACEAGVTQLMDQQVKAIEDGSILTWQRLHDSGSSRWLAQ